jgi:hypothetical protein
MTDPAMMFKTLTGVAVVDASIIDVAGYAAQLSNGSYTDIEIAEVLAGLAHRWDEALVAHLTPVGRSNPFRQEREQIRKAGNL